MATTITANGINFPDGSAGSPSIGGSDTNTGLFTGSDIVGFATGGSERLRIDASGNVNIANDSGKLQLGASNDLQIYHDGTNTYLDNNTGQFNIDAASGNAIRFLVNGSYQCQVYTSGIDLPDNKKLRLGDSEDLQIYHDGSHTWMKNATGRLILQTDGDQLQLRGDTVKFFDGDAGETLLEAKLNGSVDLYYDNSKKFETNSAGVKVTGQIEADEVYLRDSEKILLGTGSDLQIFHNGSNSFIDNSTGSLVISTDAQTSYKANTHQFETADGTETVATFNANGAVSLFHNNSKTFETTSYGAAVTGIFTSTGDIKTMNDTAKFVSGASDDLQIFHDGGDSHIKDTGTGGLYLSTNQFLVRNAAGTEFMIQGQEDGNVTLYHNGNTKAFTQVWGFQVNGVLAPQGDNTHDLGFSNERWDDVYAANGTINTSDRNEKNTITTSDLGLSFINKLKPVSYKFNNKTRTHYGLIAQDVETTLSDISKATSDFAGFIKEDIPDKLYEEDDDIPEGKSVGDVKTAAFTTYGLRYHEFISPLIKAMQELTAKVEALEAA